MSLDFNSLLQQYGIKKDEALGEPLANQGSSYYEHLIGDYKAMIGKTEVIYLDKDKKKCDASKPGAVKAYANLKFLLVADPERQLLQRDYTYNDTEEFGRLFYNQYINFDPTRQWQNIALFKNFVLDGNPESAIIQGEKGSELVHLSLLPLYVGAPVSFTLEAGTKEGSRYIKKDSLVLLDSSLVKEKIVGRGQIVEKIYAALDARLKKIQAERAKKTGSPNENAPVSEAESADSFIPDFLNNPR